MTMRIGFDARWYNDSGVGNYVAGLLAALAGFEQQLEIIAYEDPKNRIPGIERLHVRTMPIRSPKYSLREQVELAYRCHGDKLDAFHSPFYVVPFATPCPLVATMHDLIPFRFNIYSRPKQWMVRMGYRACGIRAAHIIAVSQVSAKDIENLLGVTSRRISVVHNAVSGEVFHPRARSENINYLRDKYGIKGSYVLLLSPRNRRTKNVETAFAVLTAVRKLTGSRFETVVYGSGKQIESFEGNNHTGRNVINVGFVPADDLAILLRHARVFLLTSLYEGFGLPLLEAMSCGCPVVTSNGGSLAEVAGTGAQVFDPMDVRGMSEAVTSLLCSSAERELWRSRALARAAEFSWRKAAEQTIAVYRHVTGASRKSKAELAYRHHAQSARD
jgi:glycosyltransferase involved in cell wall biosynthesis